MSVKEYDSTNKILKLIAGGTLFADCPVGVINPYGGATAPDGWLLCYGQALSRTEYADLFAVIGTSFGSGDGSTTFNVPDLRGKFAEGLPASGKTLGESVSAGLPNISGSVSGVIKYNDIFTKNGALQDSASSTTNLGASSGSNEGACILNFDASDSNAIYGGSDTVQPAAVCVNYIIKAKQTPVPADILAKLDALLSDKDYLTFSGS